MHHSQCFFNFLNASWKSCSVGMFSKAYNSALSPQLCQNRCHSALTSFRETEKSRVHGVWQSSCCIWSQIPWWKSKCGMAHCHDVTANYFVITVVCGIDRLIFQNNPLDIKKIMSMLLILFFTCLAFFVSVSLDFPCKDYIFSPKFV
jgi:hypothetical protein